MLFYVVLVASEIHLSTLCENRTVHKARANDENHTQLFSAVRAHSFPKMVQWRYRGIIISFI